MELFAEIRREYQFGVGTIKGVSRKLGVHRRVVRQALADAVPPVRAYRPRAKPTLDPVQAFIDRILEADRTAPRKQRHTARRIHDRLRSRAARRRRSRRRRCASTCGRWKRAAGPASAGRCACRRRTPGARRPKSTGTKRSRSWATRRSRCRCSVCGAWRVARRFTARIRARRSKRFSKRTRARSRYFGGRVRDPAVRQSDERRPQDPARIPARGDDAVPGVSLALAVRRGVLHAGRRPREGRRGRRGGLLPAESLGAAARRPPTSMR